MSFDFKVKQFFREGRVSPTAIAHQRWLGSFSGRGDPVALLVDPEARADVEARASRPSIAGLPTGARRADPRRSGFIRILILPDDILAKVDRASMSCGLEVRAPFLDADAGRLYPGNAGPCSNMAGVVTKRILKAGRAWPTPLDSILDRPKKGFGIPVARWLRGSARAPMVDDLLGPSPPGGSRSLQRPEEVTRRVVEHRDGCPRPPQAAYGRS